VLDEAGEADLLHFACHGWFDPRVPLSSGLVLSRPEAVGGEETPGDNGLLQAWEILQSLRLSADLVVLSACQSGLGQEVRGEGLVGLTRAFQYAGARSLVVTLWDVADESTSLFMQAFYAALKDGMAKDEALRQGVLALQADPRWDAPCY
jgi:CHAT domain-containing protein